MLVSILSDQLLRIRAHDAMEGLITPLKDSAYLPVDFEMPEDPADVVSTIREHAGDRIVHFDAECIEDDGDYAALLQSILAAVGAKDRVQNMHSHLDHENETAIVRFDVDGDPVEESWRQSDDWVAPDFFGALDRLSERVLEKRFVLLPAVDQCVEMVLVDLPHAEDLATVFAKLGGMTDPDDVSSAKVSASLITSVLGFVVTTPALWWWLGFWPALGIGVTFWVAALFWNGMRAVREAETRKEFVKAAEENPQLIADMALELFQRTRNRR